MHTDNIQYLAEGEAMSRDAWHQLSEHLRERGKPLDHLMPIYHVGGVCDVPSMCCVHCEQDLSYADFTAVINRVRDRPWYLNLNAVCSCPDCNGSTLFAQTYAPPKDRRLAYMSLRPPMREVIEAPWAEAPVSQPVHADGIPVPVFDLVARARGIVTQRREPFPHRTRPISERLVRRVMAGGGQRSLFVSTLIALVLHRPEGWADPSQWGWSLLWSTYIESAPLALVLWAVYEIGVLWASATKEKRS
ncbi:hypothetical protein [Modicisalibacter sp. MOD 31.J]|uniref:hypothetical protein n=1 Tax=Modicisalibacter sp. MOD 31.J TaxID=2831897 RepID=UPI001CCDC1E4|nr:hypothetical protein [Modicisalibacter sp. MOD 31.J]MBZ9574604.1 hypothetical protein [Modicisalibacter sp. MOD 31.J]